MSLTVSTAAGRGKRFGRSRLQGFLATHPEWWPWLLCALVWALLFADSLIAAGGERLAGHAVYCLPAPVRPLEAPAGALQQIVPGSDVLSRLPAALRNGLLPWMVMIVAMMFPLLREPLRHVAFSIRKKDRTLGTFWFLTGYLLAWAAAGSLFLPLPFLLNGITGTPAPVVHALIRASGFLLAAALVWLPGRPVRMVRCSWTMPIRIRGWQLHGDCLRYGLKMGLACLGVCWAPMLALMLAGHELPLMYAVTVVIIGERYFLPHISKLPGYAWGLLACLLFAMALWA